MVAPASLTCLLLRFSESTNSVNDILKEELFKSVVSQELTSLNSVTADSAPTTLKPPGPSNRAASTSSGAFLQSMLETLSGGGAPKAKSRTTATSNNAKPPARSMEEYTSSRNWNNLGSLEDVNINDVFRTQQESASMSQAAGEKRKGRRNWEEVMKQGLQASIMVPSLPNSQQAPAASFPSLSAAAAAMATPAKAAKPKSSKASTKRRGEPPNFQKVYYEPTDADVLLGRGGRANNHVGNKRYLELKDAMQERYMAADKNEKTEISQELVDIIRNEYKGRFLKLDPDTNQWYEVDNHLARKKASQTLREINTAEKRAEKRARYKK